MDDIDIRQAGVNDCGTILAMLTQLAGELGDGDHFSCRIEDIREHGFGGKPGVFLQDLWVSASCRDYGVGLKLLQQVALRAEQQWQACYLDLMVHSKNDGAERFYRRHGFVGHSGDQHLFLEGEAFQLLQRAT